MFSSYASRNHLLFWEKYCGQPCPGTASEETVSRLSSDGIRPSTGDEDSGSRSWTGEGGKPLPSLSGVREPAGPEVPVPERPRGFREVLQAGDPSLPTTIPQGGNTDVRRQLTVTEGSPVVRGDDRFDGYPSIIWWPCQFLTSLVTSTLLPIFRS